MQTITLRPAQRPFSLKEWTKGKRNEFSHWLSTESRFFSTLCGENFTHREVVLAHLFFVVLLMACSLAEYLEGGAL
jgi:hypothetical protein